MVPGLGTIEFSKATAVVMAMDGSIDLVCRRFLSFATVYRLSPLPTEQSDLVWKVGYFILDSLFFFSSLLSSFLPTSFFSPPSGSSSRAFFAFTPLGS